MTAFNLNTRAARSMFALALLAVVATFYALAAQGGMSGLTLDFDGGIAQLCQYLRITPAKADLIINYVLAGLSIAWIAAKLWIGSAVLIWAINAVKWLIRWNRGLARAL
ncbi:MAG: hypothetical protein WCP31_00955 [Chloroflexales bacterium]